VLNVWATYCPSCIRELPYFGQLAVEYAEHGLQIVGLVVDVLDQAGNYQQSQIELVQEILEHTGAHYLNLMPSDDLISNLLVAISAVPTTLFFDSEGRLVGQVIIGARDKATWIEIFEYHLGLI
jgi:thiol-disulfide isomerase/thioredoxin